MPIYEYRCTSCQKTFEVIQKVGDATPEGCPHCAGKVERLISRTSFQLKGGGWFRGDYGAGKPATEEKGGAAADAAPGEAAKENAKDAKEKKSEAAPKTEGCASGSSHTH